MAISKGKGSADPKEFSRFVGVAAVFITGVNPTKKELEEALHTTLEEAPVYVDTKEDPEGKTYRRARISILLQGDKEVNGIEMPVIPMNLYIQDRIYKGKSGKTQIIDKYGRTAWATEDDLAAKRIPMYSNGPADIDKDYRPAYMGESSLINLFRKYLNIPTVTVYDPNEKRSVPNTKVKPEDCEVYLEDMGKLFKGDFSEIKEALTNTPDFKVKVMFGVRTNAETGALYQAVYTDDFMLNGSTSMRMFQKAIDGMTDYANANGRTLDTEYEAVKVHEYKVAPTVFEAAPQSKVAPVEDNSDPFGEDSDSDLPWED